MENTDTTCTRCDGTGKVMGQPERCGRCGWYGCRDPEEEDCPDCGGENSSD